METLTEKLILASYYQLAYDAYRNTSFSPERRAKDTITSYSSELQEDLKLIEERGGDVERYKAKYIEKFRSWMSSRSRCYSVMITGPANFNNARHEKANNAERNKYEDFINWRGRVIDKVTRPESTDIVKGTSGALDKLNEKLQKLEELQSLMKAANKILRDKKGLKTERLIDAGFTEDNALKLQDTDRFGGTGFPSFSLTNNGAKIRNLKKDIASEERRLEKYSDGNKEYQIGSAVAIENAEENRLQLRFEGKPDQPIIKELKSNGFRWSPRNAVWQRQLTENALWSLKRMSL